MASLAEALYHLPTDRLRALVKRRDVDPKRLSLMPDKRQLAQFLSNEFSKPPSIAHAILQCNARQLRLLQLMLSSIRGRQSPGRAWWNWQAGRRSKSRSPVCWTSWKKWAGVSDRRQCSAPGRGAASDSGFAFRPLHARPLPSEL